MKIPYGAFTISELRDRNFPLRLSNGKWIPARPLPWEGMVSRIRAAWDVLTRKADAVYWIEG